MPESVGLFLPTRRIVVFTGTYQRALDGKLRVLVPKRLRSGIGEDSTWYLTPGTDHCLELHTDHSLSELALRARRSSADSKNIRSFSRLFYARAHICDLDKQGRIRIPAPLAELSHLENEVVFIGVGFHWELWNVDRWTNYLSQNDDTFDQIVQATFDPPEFDSPVNPDNNCPEDLHAHVPQPATRPTPK